MSNQRFFYGDKYEIRRTNSITIKRHLDSDPLGKVHVYFYDPLVDNVTTGIFSKSYFMHTYNTGIVEFGIAVK